MREGSKKKESHGGHEKAAELGVFLKGGTQIERD